MAQLADNPRILVTGATGFIGSELCRRLRELGYPLTALTRNTQRARKRLGEEVTLVSRLEELEETRFGAVINLAGESLGPPRRWTAKRKEQFRRSRIGTTEALFEHFQRLGDFPEVLVSGSAVGYYGDQGGKPLTEANGPADDSFSELLCRDWEAAAEAFGGYGTRVCRLRTGIVLDTGGGALQSMLPAFRLGLGGRITRKGHQWMSWIHRQDLVGLILFSLVNKEVAGALNGTAPNPVTNRFFTRTLARTLHRPAVCHVPGFVLHWLLGQMADELLLAGQRVLPEVALSHGYVFQYPELGLALDAIFSAKK